MFMNTILVYYGTWKQTYRKVSDFLNIFTIQPAIVSTKINTKEVP